jgi:signal transduction histidine kinase
LRGIAGGFIFNRILLQPAVAEHLYRIAQEALSDAVRHASPRLV